MVIQSQIWIPDHFSTCLTIAEWGILGGDMLAFLIQSLANFHNTGRNDWCRQDNEFIKFGSDPADIRIKIWINAEVRIWIPDHVSLRLDALAEACSLWAQSTCLLCHRWKLWWCIELMVNILSVNYGWSDATLMLLLQVLSPHSDVPGFDLSAIPANVVTSITVYFIMICRIITVQQANYKFELL